MVLVLCLLSNVALYLYSFMKISQTVSELFPYYFFHIQDFQRGKIL